MRLLDKEKTTLFAKGVATVAMAAGLAACSTSGAGTPDSDLSINVPQQRVNGPGSDYPITIGELYSINGTEYVPSDTLNYDHVGYLAVDADAMGYSGAHHTLPLPSYVEVTSLESGRTVLVRLERRGPMDSNDILALSPAALAQLGAAAETPVRVRRVNPPEEHRFLLRAGDAAPLRMDTPTSLLTVLQRRLPEDGIASLQAGAPAPQPSETIETIELAASDFEQPEVAETSSPVEAPVVAQAVVEPIAAVETPALPPIEATEPAPTMPTPAAGAFAAAFVERSEPEAETTPDPAPAATEPEGRFVVQAAAFSTEERADNAAESLGGFVMQAGQYWRVRTGPFATRGEAEASLANVQRAGYSDARILTGG